MAVAHATVFASTCSAQFLKLCEGLPRRSRRVFELLCWGWVLCLGRRTVTNLLRAAPDTLTRHWTCAHRFFSKSQWALDALFQRLAQHLIDPVIPADRPWCVAIDDTTAQKQGPRVAFAGKFRDASRSTPEFHIFHWSHNWIVMCVFVPLPRFQGRYLHVPVLARLFKKLEHCHADEYRTHQELALEMLTLLRQWLPHRRIEVVVDPLYNGHTLLQGLPENSALVGRLRKNAALYERAPRKVPGRAGAPRKKGRRLPTLEQVATLACFRKQWISLYGERKLRLIHSFVCLWYKASPRPIRVVIVRDPTGRQTDHFLYSTATEMDPVRIAELYPARWGVEELIRELKQSLGFETVQSWTPTAVSRQAPVALVVHAVTLLGYAQTHGFLSTDRHAHSQPMPSFHRILSTLRLECWQKRIIESLGSTSNVNNIFLPLHAVLMTAS